MRKFPTLLLIFITTAAYSQQYTIDFSFKTRVNDSIIYIPYRALMQLDGSNYSWRNAIDESFILPGYDSTNWKRTNIRANQLRGAEISTNHEAILGYLKTHGFDLIYNKNIKNEFRKVSKQQAIVSIEEKNYNRQLIKYGELRHISKSLELLSYALLVTPSTINIAAALSSNPHVIISSKTILVTTIVASIVYVTSWIIDWKAVQEIRFHRRY